MKVIIQGPNTEVNIDRRHYLATGGEGTIYAKSGVVFKICEPGKMIPEGKFRELSALTDPHIVKPEKVLLDSHRQPIGYTMRHVDKTHVLCQTFTKAFRIRHNLTPDTMLDLVRQMQNTIAHVHASNILIVDLNELNFLVGAGFDDVWFIDVNSYQTPHYPATAIMESIRDWQAGTKFTTLSDWYSFGVISFQMLIGIHPFKGKHPSVHTLPERMKAGISILKPEVSYPKGVCQPLSVVPEVYLNWYKAVFDGGKRLPPPAELHDMIQVVAPTRTVRGSNLFHIELLHDFGKEITAVYRLLGQEIVVCGQDVYFDRRLAGVVPVQSGFHLGIMPDTRSILAAWLDTDGMVKYYDVRKSTFTDSSMPQYGTQIMSTEGRFYFQAGDQIRESTFFNGFSSGWTVAQCMENSTKFYDDIIIQVVFGSHFASIFPNSKESVQYALHELTGQKVVDARHENRVILVLAVDSKGVYNKYLYKASKDWRELKLDRTEAGVTPAGLNFTVLDNGVCVLLNETENLELFKVDRPGFKLIEDECLKGDMVLFHDGAQTLFTQGSRIYSLSMKP